MTTISFKPSLKTFFLILLLESLFIFIKPDSFVIWLGIGFLLLIIIAYWLFIRKFATVEMDDHKLYIKTSDHNSIELQFKDIMFFSQTQVKIGNKPVCELVYKELDGNDKSFKFIIKDYQSFQKLEELISKNKK